MMASDAAATALGITVTSAGAGWAVATMRVTADKLNGHATTHGGLIFALADTAFGAACNSFGPVNLAASAQITFIAPALLGDELVAEAKMRTRFGRNAIFDVTIRCEDRVIAEFRGTSHELFRQPAPDG
jgi:acyl-CoA thioesterase